MHGTQKCTLQRPDRVVLTTLNPTFLHYEERVVMYYDVVMDYEERIVMDPTFPQVPDYEERIVMERICSSVFRVVVFIFRTFVFDRVVSRFP